MKNAAMYNTMRNKISELIVIKVIHCSILKLKERDFVSSSPIRGIAAEVAVCSSPIRGIAAEVVVCSSPLRGIAAEVVVIPIIIILPSEDYRR